MEALLHYTWKHKMLPLRPLTTTTGLAVEVIDVGLHNHDSGPDFFNAKLRVDGTVWVGNVEIHRKASDWYAHGHDKDHAYDNVVMHIVGEDDAQAVTADGRQLPQMVLNVPEKVKNNYEALLHTDRYPPCYAIIPSLDRLTTHSWLSSLLAERLEQKTTAIAQRVAAMGGDWEAALFITMARNYGFGLNGEAFEAWAKSVPLQSAAHHRDDLFQIEALFMGQAGLLDPQSMTERHREAAIQDGYFLKLQAEYKYLAHKFALKPINAGLWRFFRLRPQSFPHIRLSQLAQLYCSRKSDLSRLRECRTVSELRTLLSTHATPYWQTHYAFGCPSGHSMKSLSAASLNLLIINTAVPTLFAYGKRRRDETLCDRSLNMLSQLRAENNNIVRQWKECGLSAETAADSQALIQLKREYCDKKDCLRCRIGYKYLKCKGSEPRPQPSP